jgi:hypothetical protein
MNDIVCDWCEESTDVRFRVDAIERGEGFSYDVCEPCKDEILKTTDPEAEVTEI